MSEPESNQSDVTFTSNDSLVVVFEGPGDNTRRPRRPNNPRDWPRPEIIEQPPPASDGKTI